MRYHGGLGDGSLKSLSGVTVSAGGSGGRPAPLICLFSHSAGLGGAERSFTEVVSALSALGYQLRIMAPRRGPLVSRLAAEGLQVTRIPFRWWTALPGIGWPRRGLRTLWNLGVAVVAAGHLRRWRADLVYSNTLASCVGGLAARIARLPHVWHIREFGREHSGTRFDLGEKIAMMAVKELCDLVLVASRALAEKYGGIARPGRLQVLYQPVLVDDAWPVAPPADDILRCVVVGSFGPGKRQLDVVEAMALLKPTIRARVELDMAGGGEQRYRQRVLDAVAQAGLQDRIRIHGEVPNAIPLIAASRVLISASQFEGFGRVIVEAMKLGRCVVGADSGATPELIRHGETGFLYPVGDVAALAQILVRLAAHGSECDLMGAAARHWANRRFTEGEFRAGLGTAFETVLRDRAEGRKAQVS